MLNKTEQMILKIIAKNKLITKTELKAYLHNDGGINSEALESITRNLIQKNLVTAISPVGSTCFVITQKGTKFLEEMR